MPSRASEIKVTKRTPASPTAVEPTVARPPTAGQGPIHSEHTRLGKQGGAAEGQVDEVLESLHRSLKDQETVRRLLAAIKKPTSDITRSRTDTQPTLSGATTSRKPQRRRPQKQNPPLKESRAISSARCLVAAAESLGLDMSAARPLISCSERNLKKRRQKAAAIDAGKALIHARNAAAIQLRALIPELEAKNGNLRACGGRSLSAEKGLAAAKAALKKRNFRTAIAAVSGTKKVISEAETSFIRRILLESREKFVSARKAGANIDTAVRALMRAKEDLRQGDLEAAVRMARRAETAVEVTMRAHRDASRALAALNRALAIAEQVDAEAAEYRQSFDQSKSLFENGAYFKSTELAKQAFESVDKSLKSKIQESIERAERAVALARDAGAPIAASEAKLKETKAKLSEREYMKSLALANEVLVDGTSEAFAVLKERIGGIGQFAKSVEGEIDSLSQVQDAIVHSRERSLEVVRKYSSMSEDVVSQAYDNAAAYMRVSQDIVKQAYDSSIGLGQENKPLDTEPRPPILRSPTAAQIFGIANGDRKLRIIDLYLSGRIDDKQLDKLLALVDSSQPGIEISDDMQEAQFAKR